MSPLGGGYWRAKVNLAACVLLLLTKASNRIDL
jgi:hypothetical protein